MIEAGTKMPSLPVLRPSGSPLDRRPVGSPIGSRDAA